MTWTFLFIMFYWGYCVFWGIRGAGRAHTADDYFLGGRQIPCWVFIPAATATIMSGWTFVAMAGTSYTDSLPYTLTFLHGIAIPFTGALFLKRQWILGRRFGFVTPGEMLAYYFRSDLIRVLVVVVAVVFSVPYIGLQLRAAGFLFNALTDGMVGVEFSMWVLGLVLVSYVATGGLRTVAYVDTLQAVLLAAGIVILGVAVLSWVGGWERLLEGIAVLSQTDNRRTPAGYSHYVAIPGSSSSSARAWAPGKAFDQSVPISTIHPVSEVGHPQSGAIWLKVNGEIRQNTDLSQMVWPLPDIIVHIAQLNVLQPGDLIYTGTPEGVGPVQPGDHITGGVDGVDTIDISIAATNP